MTLDHGSGQVSIGHNNLLPQEMAGLVGMLQSVVGGLMREQERQQIRTELEAELTPKSG